MAVESPTRPPPAITTGWSLSATSELSRNPASGGGPRSIRPRVESRRHLLPHEPALDGIRALAVVAVLLYHGHVSWMKGGFLGVDAFFVLSGFLITSLLLTEWNARGAIDLRSFWLRRCRRLLPAMLVVVAAVSAYAAVLAARDELDELRSDTFATLGYAANWRAIAVGDQYGDLFSVPSPLQHTWSLAIEEQWYLLWPLLLLGLLFAARRHAVVPLAAIGTMVLGSAALMAWVYDPADLARSYYGTDTRCQSLLVGAGLALVARHVRVGRWIPVLAIAALAWLWATTSLEASWLYHGGFLLCAVLVAVVIVAAMHPGPVRSLLSLRPLPQIGLISYGLYLWHWPVYVVLSSARTNVDGWALLMLRICVTGILAMASYVLIERPVRAGTFRLPRPALSVPAVVAGVAAIALVATSGGRPSVVFAAPTAPPTTVPADSLGARVPGTRRRQENQPDRPWADSCRGRGRLGCARDGRRPHASRPVVRVGGVGSGSPRVRGAPRHHVDRRGGA